MAGFLVAIGPSAMTLYLIWVCRLYHSIAASCILLELAIRLCENDIDPGWSVVLWRRSLDGRIKSSKKGDHSYKL